MTKVSVVIPAYNQSHYLGGAIQSVLNQTYHDYEIIVVDDGSTDNCDEVVSEFGENVRYIWQENKGLAGARNTGIRAAKGEFLGFLDSDDEWRPEFLEQMMALVDQHPHAAVYFCCAQGMDVDGHDLPQIYGGQDKQNADIYQELLKANFLIPSTIVMRHEVAKEAGLFDQSLRYCEDWDLWLRVAPKYLFVGTSVSLVRYRLHSNSLSGDVSKTQRTKKLVIEKYFGSDDGNWETWSQEKRWIYGGLYRFQLIASVQRQKDWQSGAELLNKALRADPTLATDLSLFYDLALGNQPPGYRGSPQELDFEDNIAHIQSMLDEIFVSVGEENEAEKLMHHTKGTAFYAIGLLGYNIGRFDVSRKFLRKAVVHRPDMRKQAASIYLRTLAGKGLMEVLRKLKGKRTSI